MRKDDIEARENVSGSNRSEKIISPKNKGTKLSAQVLRMERKSSDSLEYLRRIIWGGGGIH